MPVSVSRLMFKDPELKKLAPSGLEIGIYTTDIIKIMGSPRFYLVHPESKKLLDVTFFVAINDGSMLLSCKTTSALGLIQPRSRLDYLSPRARLITSSVGHPKKTKSVKISVHWSRQEVATQSTQQKASAQTPAQKQDVSKLITAKEQILVHYPDVFDSIGMFPGPNIQYPARSEHSTKANTMPSSTWSSEGEL